MIRPIRFPLPQAGQDPSRTPAKAGQPQAAKLNGAEREMIDTNFPASARMSLRLYGPARPVGVAPEAIGSRIDLKG